MGGQLDPKKSVLADGTGAAVLGLAVLGSQLADTKDQVSVDVELIIGVDVSNSMDMDELEGRVCAGHRLQGVPPGANDRS
jgi:hypothetical protein